MGRGAAHLTARFFEKQRMVFDRLFPERQIYFRSRGEVKFVKVAPSVQFAGAMLTAFFAMWVVFSTFHVLSRDAVLESKNARIDEVEKAYDALAGEMADLERDVAEKATTLEERQGLLARMIDSFRAATPEPADREPTPADAASEKAPTKDKEARNQSAEELAVRLAAIDRRQREVASELVRLTEGHVSLIAESLAPTGISPEDLLQQDGAGPSSAQGGPLIPIGLSGGAAGNDEAVDDDPLHILAVDLVRLQAVNDALDSFPALEPTDKYYISSYYGRRRDPIRKIWSMHYGLDMAGWPGTSIFATADGTVTKAGLNGPYGKFIEIDHGNGFKTRYGHLRALKVGVGDSVSAGQRIGEMGNTGRVTSTHLHYEVWFAGKPLDPLAFIKVSENVLKIKGRTRVN